MVANGAFDVEDREAGGRWKWKCYKDAELEVLIEEGSCQMQEELAFIFEGTQQTISTHWERIKRKQVACQGSTKEFLAFHSHWWWKNDLLW